LYGGGPCTTILHSNLRPTLPIFSEIVGLGRFENSKCHVPWATTGQSPPALQYSALMDGKRPKHVISPVRELDPDPGHPEIYISLPPQPSTQGDAYIYTTMPRAPSARTPANWPTGPVLSRLPASPVARAPARRLLALDSPVSSPAVPPPPPTRQLASALPPQPPGLPPRPPSGVAPAPRQGPKRHPRWPPPRDRTNGAQPTAGALHERPGKPRGAGRGGSPFQGPPPPTSPEPSRASLRSAPRPQGKGPQGKGPRPCDPGPEGPRSLLHILTDPIWVIKRHATVNGARKCWWGTFLYGGCPCTTILHSKLRPTLPIFSEIVGLGRFENSDPMIPPGDPSLLRALLLPTRPRPAPRGDAPGALPCPSTPARSPIPGSRIPCPPANWWEYMCPPFRSPSPPARQLVGICPPALQIPRSVNWWAQVCPPNPRSPHFPDPPPARQLAGPGPPFRSPISPGPSTGGNMPALQIPVSHFPRPPVNWLAEMVLPDPRRPAVPCPRFFLTMGNVRGDTNHFAVICPPLSVSRS
jgi:hypothetical protein